MYSVDLLYLSKIAAELEMCARSLSREILHLEMTIRNLQRLESKGMDQVRRVLRKKQEELREELRMVRALLQALQRIISTYRRSEDTVVDLFEFPFRWSGGFIGTFEIPNFNDRLSGVYLPTGEKVPYL